MKTIYSPESKRLSEWLRQQRETKGLTMRQAAGLLNKPHSFVGKIEIGQRRLDIVEYVWYCHTLGFDPIKGLNLIIEKPHHGTF